MSIPSRSSANSSLRQYPADCDAPREKSNHSIRNIGCFTDGLSKSAVVVRKSGHFTDDHIKYISFVRKSGHFTDGKNDY